jgi:tetratricopeptide (TPR) repeat protein
MNDRKGALADYNQALELTRKNHLDPDSLKSDRIDYLKKLTKLSGDFEQMNAMSSKLQNQTVDIQLKPMFTLLIWKADFGKVRPYDVYSKAHYPINILTMTNLVGVMSDTVLLREVERQTRINDSAGPVASALYRRAIALIQLRSFERAFRDLDQFLALDTTDVTAWFCRAGVRYEMIRQLILQGDLQREITIGKKLSRPAEELSPSSVEHTYEMVVSDYERSLKLDPEFAYGWYNLGFVNTQMGNYREALDDFSRAVARMNDFAEAWYNRGLVSILLNENHNGCKDLSRAGELGVTDAYRVMKRYCYK